MPIIIHNLQGSYTTPSVVSLNEAREIIVGEPAKQNLWMDPTNTVSEIKREMGTDFKVTMGGEPYNPQMISAFILRYLKQCAEKYLGEPVHDAVITVPAYFEEPQRVATSDAASIAGLNVGRLLNEPTAAALAYGVAKSSSEEGSADADSDEVYAVYDLGGGTFDVSIIRISSQDVTVVGTGGDSRLGGLDMDEAVANWAIRRIKEEQGIDLSGDQAVKLRLKVESEGIKKVLVASATAMSSWFTSTTNSAPGSSFISRMPSKLRCIRAISRLMADSSFLGSLAISPLVSICWKCLNLAIERLIVPKLVSVPPSQRLTQ
jgi:molecular chaperone DnaK